MHILSMLMWKHCIVRKRRYLLTIVQFIVPLLFFPFLFTIGEGEDANQNQSISENDNNSMTLEEVPSRDFALRRPLQIAYLPDTPLAASLMKEAASVLHVIPIVNILPFDEAMMSEYETNLDNGNAIVILQNMTGNKLPLSLTYTIRTKETHETKRKPFVLDLNSKFLRLMTSRTPQGAKPYSRKNIGQNNETFLQIQWAIDTSYIKLRTGNNINQTIYLRPLPNEIETYSPKPKIAMVIGYLCILSYLALLLNFVFTVHSLLEEKTSGIEELIKMVGARLLTIGFSHFLNAVPPGLIFALGGTIILKASGTLIPHSSFMLIFLALLLHYNSIIALAFLCSQCISSSTSHVTAMSVLLYIASGAPTFLVPEHVPYVILLLYGFLPHTPLLWFWFEVLYKELNDEGVDISSIWDSEREELYLPPIFAFGYLIVQGCLFYLFAWYFANINPGKFGQPLPWNFVFDKHYWKTRELLSTAALYEESRLNMSISHAGDYFEPPPAEDMIVGIRVDNVSKAYPQAVVLRDVSLEAYRGEITVLLGHNGAGKTTLMYIIAGMTAATKGEVQVDGIDTSARGSEVRKHLGLCPQLHLFFPDLTVREHVIFFSELKKSRFSEGRRSADLLIQDFGLKEQRDLFIRELSNGYKRRVQLACAFTGDADVLILDEPTAGLDVYSKRDLWDLLLSLHGGRTVLLSTHSMEEADVLADRIAVLHHGELRCFATTTYLKNLIDSGYHLTLTTIDVPKEPEITQVVTSHEPDAVVKEIKKKYISYTLPLTASEKFPQLFEDLEQKKTELGIQYMRVRKSSLDEVFIKLCSDIQKTSDIDAIKPAEEPNFDSKVRLTGCRLCLRQFKALLKRQWLYAISKKWVFWIGQILIPIVLIGWLTWHYNNDEVIDAIRDREPLSLGLADEDTKVLYNLGLENAAIGVFMNEFPRVRFQDSAKALRYGTLDLYENNTNNMLGVYQLDDVSATAFYTTTMHHAASVSLNLLSNLVAARYIPHINTTTIRAHYEPLYVKPMASIPPKDLENIILWAHFVTFILIMSHVINMTLPCKERESGSRHIHIMCGCAPELYWGATLVFHVLLALLVIIVPMGFFCYGLESDETIDDVTFILMFSLIYFLGSLAVLSFMYLISCNFREKTTSMLLVAGALIFGLFTSLVKGLQNCMQSSKSWYFPILELFFYLIPLHTLSEGALKCSYVARLNGYCTVLRDEYCDRIDEVKVDMEGFNMESCCFGTLTHSYFGWTFYTPDLAMYVLIGQFLVSMLLVLASERGLIKWLRDWLLNISYKPLEDDEVDYLVLAEKDYVKKAMDLPPKEIPDAMLVHNVHKRYRRECCEKVNVLRGVSFSVKKGECFCILGLGGAGKSTLLKLITTEDYPTRGRLFANGQHLKTGRLHYMQSLGYLPQARGMDTFLTAEQYLVLLLTLRGLDEESAREEAAAWINATGLHKYSERVISHYSYGCARRLGSAAALCGGASVVLLDEPTAGVDVSARRTLWAAIRRAREQGRAVVVTSYCLDEVEALGSRLAIMRAGSVRALGTCPALRDMLVCGHSVHIKLDTDTIGSHDSQHDEFMMKFEETFDCTLKDESLTLLHYHINETLPYSSLFSSLETLKQQFPRLVEDYAVTETTLEEVFLSLAEEQTAN